MKVVEAEHPDRRRRRRSSRQRRLDGKVTYLGLDVDADPVEPGKDFKLTHYWKVVAPPGDGLEDFTHLEGPNHRASSTPTTCPVKRQVPGQRSGRPATSSATSTPSAAGDLAARQVDGLRRPVARAERMPIKAGPHDAEGRVLAATIPVSAAKPAAGAKRYVARKIDQGAIKLDGKLDEAAWNDAPSTGAVREHA